MWGIGDTLLNLGCCSGPITCTVPGERGTSLKLGTVCCFYMHFFWGTWENPEMSATHSTKAWGSRCPGVQGFGGKGKLTNIGQKRLSRKKKTHLSPYNELASCTFKDLMPGTPTPVHRPLSWSLHLHTHAPRICLRISPRVYCLPNLCILGQLWVHLKRGSFALM